MNSSRLAELERQRALVREQLAWLEREIAREGAAISESPVSGPVDRPLGNAPVAPKTPVSQSASKLAAYPAAEIAERASAFDEYQPDPKNAAQSARHGCLIAAVAVFVLSIAGFLTLYFVHYSDRPLLFPSRSGEAVGK